MIGQSAFWVILVAAFAAGRLIGTTPVRRAMVFALAGLAGIATLFNLGLTQLAAMGVAVGSITIGTIILRRNPRIGTALGGIGIILAIWVLGKAAQGLGWGTALPILFVGISYMLVKAWSLYKDMIDGKMVDPSVAEVLGFLLHLPTLPIGPMHQFSEFRAGLEAPYSLTGERLIDCVFRIVLGLVKTLIVANLLAPASLSGIGPMETIDPLRLVLSAFIYSVVLYADFSGYCDIAIGTSRLMGMDVPENFNWPYLASSLRDFWRRWHITFSRMLTAHIFMPLSRILARKMPKAPARAAAIGNTVTFAFCGYWHGATLNFVIWGLWHALGLIVQDWNVRRLRKKGWRPPQVKPWPIRIRDTALTFSFVSIGWIFFALPVGAWGRISWGS